MQFIVFAWNSRYAYLVIHINPNLWWFPCLVVVVLQACRFTYGGILFCLICLQLCIAVPCHIFKFWAFFGIMFQVIILWLLMFDFSISIIRIIDLYVRSYIHIELTINKNREKNIDSVHRIRHVLLLHNLLLDMRLIKIIPVLFAVLNRFPWFW